jgi:hypothetical protein
MDEKIRKDKKDYGKSRLTSSCGLNGSSDIAIAVVPEGSNAS